MWVLGLVVLIDQVDQNLVRGVVPQLKSDFGIDDFGIGVLISAFVLVNGIVTVPAGYLADRWHRTRTIGHTVVAWSGITMLTAASQNFGQLIAGRALLGFGQAITEPSANSLISDYYPTEQRGSAFSVQQIMGIIGFGVGIALGGAIGSQFGWHWAFIVVGPPGFVIAAIAYRLREPSRGHGDRLHLGITEDEPAEEHQRLFEHGVRRFFVDMMTGLRDDLRVILSIPTLKFALVGVGAFMFTITGIGAWLPEFHRRFSGLTQEQATTAVGLIVLAGGIPGLLLGGSDRRPVRAPHPRRARRDPRVLHRDRHRPVHDLLPADAVRRVVRCSSSSACSRCGSPSRRSGPASPTRFPRTSAAPGSARSTSCRSCSAPPPRRSSSAPWRTSSTSASRSSSCRRRCSSARTCCTGRGTTSTPTRPRSSRPSCGRCSRIRSASQ